MFPHWLAAETLRPPQRCEFQEEEEHSYIASGERARVIPFKRSLWLVFKPRHEDNDDKET